MNRDAVADADPVAEQTVLVFQRGDPLVCLLRFGIRVAELYVVLDGVLGERLALGSLGHRF